MKSALLAALTLVLSGGIKGQDYEKLLKAAKFTLSEAIDLGQKEAGKDCVVVSAEMEEEKGKMLFSLAFANGDKELEVNLDIATGKLVGKDDEGDNYTELVKALKISLKDAIATALKKETGKAVEAKFVLNKDKKPEGEVKIFNEGKIRVVTINGVTGEVISAKDEVKKEKPKDGMDKDDD